MLRHEAIIDAAWDNALWPLLLQRFPGLGAEELRKARAYAYGGSILQGTLSERTGWLAF
ncbi:MAG TPA: hypothetical protein VER03_14655 [Bryobacteraceae bacterium]|nr:hypothetical protein [Bryobacteraceae bacterium]